MTRLLDRWLPLSANLLRLAFLLLVLDIGLLALLDSQEELAESLFRTGFALMALALLSWAVAKLLSLFVERFDLGDAIRVALSLLFGGIGLQVVMRDDRGSYWLVLAALIYLLLGLALWFRSRRKQPGPGREEDAPEHEQDNDPGIRGSVSIFMTGSDSYRLVKRHDDPDTPASRFQARLLRYVERKTGRRLLAFSGDGCDYWRVPSELSQIELMVIGPGFNTRTPPAEGTDWILRIRETAPFRFGEWMAKHFPEGCAVTRELPGGKRMTQFSSRCVEDERAFFRQEIDAPDLDRLEPLGLTPGEAGELLDILERLKEEDPTDSVEDQKPRRLH